MDKHTQVTSPKRWAGWKSAQPININDQQFNSLVRQTGHSPAFDPIIRCAFPRCNNNYKMLKRCLRGDGI